MFCGHALLRLLRRGPHAGFVDPHALEQLLFLKQIFLRGRLLLRTLLNCTGAFLWWDFLLWRSRSIRSGLISRGGLLLTLRWWVVERPYRSARLETFEAMLWLHVWVTLPNLDVGEVISQLGYCIFTLKQNWLLLLLLHWLLERNLSLQLLICSFNLLGPLQSLVVLQADLHRGYALFGRVVCFLVCLHLE